MRNACRGVIVCVIDLFICLLELFVYLHVRIVYLRLYTKNNCRAELLHWQHMLSALDALMRDGSLIQYKYYLRPGLLSNKIAIALCIPWTFIETKERANKIIFEA